MNTSNEHDKGEDLIYTGDLSDIYVRYAVEKFQVIKTHDHVVNTNV